MFKTVPIPSVTSLADMVDDFNSTLSCVITFSIFDQNEKLIMNTTIPFCRFRDTEGQPEYYEVRSCDCEGVVCGHPVQSLYVSKTVAKDYIYIETKMNSHYFFFYRIENKL